MLDFSVALSRCHDLCCEMAPEHWEDALGKVGHTRWRAASPPCCIALLPAVLLPGHLPCSSSTASHTWCFPCVCPGQGEWCRRAITYTDTLREKGATDVSAAQPSLLSITAKPCLEKHMCMEKTFWNPSTWANWIKVKLFSWHLLPQLFTCRYTQMYSFALCLPLWEHFVL